MNPETRPEELATVHRALSAVELIAHSGGLSLTELAEQMGIGLSTAHRLLSTLVRRDWLVKDDRMQYHLGSELSRIQASAEASSSIQALLRPLTEKLRDETGEIVHVTKLEGRSVIYLDQLFVKDRLSPIPKVSGKMPAHAVSPGIALVSRQPAEFVNWFLSLPLTRFSPRTTTSTPRFRAQLEKARDRGFSVNFGGYRLGISGIGTAVCDTDGTPICGLSICIPTRRLESSDTAQITTALLATAAAAESVLRAGQRRD